MHAMLTVRGKHEIYSYGAVSVVDSILVMLFMVWWCRGRAINKESASYAPF